MKSLKEQLISDSTNKYCINWIDKDGHNLRYTTNNYQSFIKGLDGNYTYYEVMDTSKSNFSEPEALIEWSGKDGYWANAYLASTDPENAPKWFTGFKGSKLKKIEQCKK